MDRQTFQKEIQFVTNKKVETSHVTMLGNAEPQITTNVHFKKVVIESDGKTTKQKEFSMGGDNLNEMQLEEFKSKLKLEAPGMDMRMTLPQIIKKQEIRLIPLNEKEMQEKEKQEKEKEEIAKKYKTMFDYDEEVQQEAGNDTYTQVCTFLKDSLLLITAFSVDVIANCTIIYPSIVLLSLYNMLKLLGQLCSSANKIEVLAKQLIFLVIILGSCATIYLQVMSFFYMKSNTIERFWFLDALIYFMSTVLVCSYIKCIQAEISTYSEIFNFNYFYGPKVINTLFMSASQEEPAYVFDCVTDNDNKIILNEYKRIMKENQIQQLAQRFNLFKVEGEPINLECKGVEIVMGCNKNLSVQLSQYITLIAIIALKTIVSLTYIFLQKQDFGFQTGISIVVTTLFYINMTWCLNKVIGNYDLRRKVIMMEKVNSLIDYKSTEGGKHSNLIDATDSISFEAWDNTRKFVYQYFSSKISRLEFVYVCLFFYYVFVTVICVVAYGEFYQIIPKESLYLQPLMVIQNTFDFVFLNVILVWRIYQGQKLNDSFDDSQDHLDYLIGMTEDLIQMFDIFFLPERKLGPGYQNPNTYLQIDQEDMKSMNMATQQTDKDEDLQKSNELNQNITRIRGSSVYGQFVLRIKFLSHYYINNKVFYLGTLYDTSTKRVLQKEILKNMLNSFRKVKEQVNIDSRQMCYKFLNIFKLEFTDIITTVLLAFLSILPNVIPKLIEIFQAADDVPPSSINS